MIVRSVATRHKLLFRPTAIATITSSASGHAYSRIAEVHGAWLRGRIVCKRTCAPRH